MPHYTLSSGMSRDQQRMWEREHQLHRQRLTELKPCVDNTTPQSCAHSFHRGAYDRNERAKKINAENVKLMEQLLYITETKGDVDNTSPFWHTNTAVDSIRRRKQRKNKLDRENALLLHHLVNVKSTYQGEKWIADRRQNEIIAQRISRFPYVPFDRQGDMYSAATSQYNFSTSNSHEEEQEEEEDE